MKNDSLILVKLSNIHIKSFINFLIYNKIYYKDLKIESETAYIKLNYSSYSLIKKRYKKHSKIISYYGVLGLFNFIKIHRYILISILWGFLMLYMLSNTVFEVIINTNDDILQKIIKEQLDESDIKKYKFKKSFKDLTKIKEEILNNNKERLEWIEIKEKGTKYIVELTPRIIKDNKKEDDSPRHIVAKKDALIMYLKSSNGEKTKDVNDYVKKGDIIISGDIHKADNIVKQVKAEGEVYGEVWYTVNTTIPFEYTEYAETGDVINHYYLDIFGKKMTIMGKFESDKTMNEQEVIIDKPYLFFKVVKEKKTIYEYKTFKLSGEEAYNEAIKRSDKKIEGKLSKGEYIIEKKVLKNNKFSSKINIEVFYKVYENITSTSKIVKEEKE